MTRPEYCAFEREATIKHEYIAGKVSAMAGKTLAHSRIGAKIIQLLANALDGRPCEVYTSDARVRIEAVDADVYPDVSVVCGEPQTDEADDHALLNPTLVVEVLSPSIKASYYRRIPSLRAYLLVAQDRPQLELHVRNAEGHWVIREAGPGQQLAIEPLDVVLAVDAIYPDAPC